MGLVRAEIKGVELNLTTATELFSPEQIDSGTLAMLSTVDFAPRDKVLDLGCGYGVVGILAAKLIGSGQITMVDINEHAVLTARRNAITNGVPEVQIYVSNGLKEVKDNDFTLILSNPPYHEDFSVPKAFIEDGFAKLIPGGRMVMVVKRLTWYKNKLTSVFGGVTVAEIDGYYVLTSLKREKQPMQTATTSKPSKKHQKRLEESQKWKKRVKR